MSSLIRHSLCRRPSEAGGAGARYGGCGLARPLPVVAGTFTCQGCLPAGRSFHVSTLRADPRGNLSPLTGEASACSCPDGASETDRPTGIGAGRWGGGPASTRWSEKDWGARSTSLPPRMGRCGTAKPRCLGDGGQYTRVPAGAPGPRLGPRAVTAREDYSSEARGSGQAEPSHAVFWKTG